MNNDRKLILSRKNLRVVVLIFSLIFSSLVTGLSSVANAASKDPKIKWTVKVLSAKSLVTLDNLVESDSLGKRSWSALGNCKITKGALRMTTPGNCELSVKIEAKQGFNEISRSKQFPVKTEKPVQIRLGCFTGPQLIWAYYLIDNAAKNGLDIKCQKITNFADAQIAIESGQTDIAPLGYHQVATIRANKLWVIAGYARGGNELIVGPSTKISSWSDLEGKSIGVFVGSWAKILFEINIKEKNISLKKLVLFNSVPPMLAALKSGDIDGMFMFETINAVAVRTLGASYAPLDYSDNSVGDLNGIITVTKQFGLEHPVLVTKFLAEVINAQKALTADRALWAAITQRESGATLVVSQTSVSRTQFVTGLNERTARAMCLVAPLIGVTTTANSECATGLLNYDFLTEATGLTAVELGKNK